MFVVDDDVVVVFDKRAYTPWRYAGVNLEVSSSVVVIVVPEVNFV